MDFKALMSAQISKTKPTTSHNNKPAEITQKYQRRSDQEAKRIADYKAEQESLEKEREARAAKKRKLEEDEAEQNRIREEKKRKLAEESQKRREADDAEQERLRRKRLGLPESSDTAEDVNGHANGTSSSGETDAILPEGLTDIEDTELRSKLREIDEPATLYDESHASRLRRYHRATTTTTTSKSTLTKSKKPRYYTDGPIPTTLEPVTEKDMLLPSPKELTTSTIPPNTDPQYEFLHRQISSYISLLLKEWSLSLSQRENHVKQSQEGKRAQQTYQTVLQDLTPFYKRLEQKSLTNDLLIPIIEILHHIQSRKYVTANDTYLRLSIGKAAWPIGVTMVGIHERSAREKLHDGDGSGSNKAHIMADEITRKILQSLKRCLSFAQTRWPPDDVGELMG